MYSEYRQRTEQSLPFTMREVEDCIFVDDHKMISLELIFYQNDAKYYSLEKIDPKEGD